MSRRVIFTVAREAGTDVIFDEIAFEAGALLRDVASTKRNNPLVPVSGLIGVRLEDDEAAERARAERARLTAVYLENDIQKENEP